MNTKLVKYEAACYAIAECVAVDEVIDWADKAAAMQAYGRMAKDKTLEVDAAEIRIRAERRLGELIAQQKANGGLSKGAATPGVGKAGANAVVSNDRVTPTLADAGISKDLSSRAQKLAAVPAETFEAELAAKRERDKQEGARVSARLEQAGARELAKQRAEPAPEESDTPSADEMLDELHADLSKAENRCAELEKALTDSGKEQTVLLLRRLEQAERARDDAMAAAQRSQARADRYEKLLARCGRAVGDRDLDKVAAKVEAMARRMRESEAA